eukprot:TRINITY_DN17762_c0_g1_i1.p1 TRINITY_DN17762_c0_g1~~TRINITY_DN17762_c0_g1_i1.p1  ORF type:complete len:149 (+),score=18.38 TRINITY_DN17762_c0_g1_i1:53-499(+)
MELTASQMVVLNLVANDQKDSMSVHDVKQLLEALCRLETIDAVAANQLRAIRIAFDAIPASIRCHDSIVTFSKLYQQEDVDMQAYRAAVVNAVIKSDVAKILSFLQVRSLLTLKQHTIDAPQAVRPALEMMATAMQERIDVLSAAVNN